MRGLAIIASALLGAPPALFAPGGERPVSLQRTPEGVASQSAQACAGCHSEIHLQWRESMHSAAWNDPQFQELWRAERREARCLNCHSPLVAQQRKLEGAPNPAYRPTLQAEGVTCAACHVRDGKIVGAGTSTGESSHPIWKVPELAEAASCGGCHQLPIAGRDKGLYDTMREWEAVAAPGAGGCRDCHMPMRLGNVATGVLRPYRSHAFEGAHSDVMLQRALTVSVTLAKPVYLPGEEVSAVVEVRNTGAAHSVPSGDPLHQIRLEVGLADTTGELLEKKETVFARKLERRPPYKERADTRLEAGSSRRVRFDTLLPGGAGEHYLIVQLSYHLMPQEKARELGIPADVTSRVFDTQIIPIGP